MTSPSELETSNAIVAGQGSMGRVFRVDADVYNALTVPELASSDYSALKVLERPSLRQRFVDEFGMLRRLSSPIFVQAQRLGVLRENQQLTSQLEWCRGAPLST